MFPNGTNHTINNSTADFPNQTAAICFLAITGSLLIVPFMIGFLYYFCECCRKKNHSEEERSFRVTFSAIGDDWHQAQIQEQINKQGNLALMLANILEQRRKEEAVWKPLIKQRDDERNKEIAAIKRVSELDEQNETSGKNNCAIM